MGMGFAPTWLRQVSPPPCFTKPRNTLTAGRAILCPSLLRNDKQIDLIHCYSTGVATNISKLRSIIKKQRENYCPIQFEVWTQILASVSSSPTTWTMIKQRTIPVLLPTICCRKNCGRRTKNTRRTSGRKICCRRSRATLDTNPARTQPPITNYCIM